MDLDGRLRAAPASPEWIRWNSPSGRGDGAGPAAPHIASTLQPRRSAEGEPPLSPNCTPLATTGGATPAIQRHRFIGLHFIKPVAVSFMADVVFLFSGRGGGGRGGKVAPSTTASGTCPNPAQAPRRSRLRCLQGPGKWEHMLGAGKTAAATATRRVFCKSRGYPSYWACTPAKPHWGLGQGARN